MHRKKKGVVWLKNKFITIILYEYEYENVKERNLFFEKFLSFFMISRIILKKLCMIIFYCSFSN